MSPGTDYVILVALTVGLIGIVGIISGVVEWVSAPIRRRLRHRRAVRYYRTLAMLQKYTVGIETGEKAKK